MRRALDRGVEAVPRLLDRRIYPGMGHTINRDELEAVDAILAGGGHEDGSAP